MTHLQCEQKRETHRQVGPWDSVTGLARRRLGGRGSRRATSGLTGCHAHSQGCFTEVLRRGGARWPRGITCGCSGVPELAACLTHGRPRRWLLRGRPRVLGYPCAGGNASQDPRVSHSGRSECQGRRATRSGRSDLGGGSTLRGRGQGRGEGRAFVRVQHSAQGSGNAGRGCHTPHRPSHRHGWG